MYYVKEDVLRRNISLTLADTYKFDDLPETGKSAGLLLVFKSPINSGQHLTYGDYGDKLRFADWFSKIQLIVDGKRPLKDLNAVLCQALEYWNSGQVARDRYMERSIGADTCYVPITFGRYLGDVEYYLNWEDYSSIELDVTNTMTSPPYASATMDIINYKIEGEGVPVSKGVFQERIWRELTTVADKTEYLKPPIGNKYRRIILQATPAVTTSYPYYRKRSFWYLMNEIQLGFKERAELFYDAYGLELLEKNIHEHPYLAHTGGQALGSASTFDVDTFINCSIGRRTWAQATPMEVGTDVTENNLGIWPYADDLLVVYADRATNTYIQWMAKGMGYMNTMALLFDRFGMDNILDSNEKSPITLDIKTENNANAAGGTNKIILSELVSR